MKICKTCFAEKDERDFNKHAREADGLFPTCRACQSLQYAAWYERNKGRVRARDKALYDERYAKIVELKSRPCSDCGDCFPPCCMDFDHVRGQKKFALCKMGGIKWERVLEELRKCDLVCANCHRIRTADRRIK